ncbi:hypothetical protein ACQ4LE_000224, partial [Meloidogyne hapla]
MADQNLPPRPPQSVTPRTGVPQWSITRRERTEMTPPGRSSSRSGTEGGDSDSDSGGIYRARTVTSTERVQIVQMPMELSQVSSEQLEMISLSPQTEASREVCTTTTTIEAGAVPIVGGVTNNGVPLVNGIFLNRESRRTTTIITTTKTTYKILEDTSDDDLEFVQMPESTISTSTATTIKEKDDFIIINKTDSSITSTSEDDDNDELKSSTSSLLLKRIPLKNKNEEDDEETVITTTNTTIEKLEENKEKEENLIVTSNIVVIPSEIRSPPYSPHSFANTSTFSSPNSEGVMHTFDDEELCAELAKAAEASISPSFIYKTTTTRPVGEINEEPLEHWVMLPDSQQQLKECSTQTMLAEELEGIPSTSRWNEAKSVEIDNYVYVYSNGYYSDLIEEKKSPIENLFETNQHSQLKETQLDQHVNVYSSGYSDEIKTKTTKEYPKIEAPFIGHIPETKHHDIHHVPFEVENNYIGYYEHLPPTNQEEKKPGTLEKITKFFKGSKTEGEFPVDSEPYIGPIATTDITSESTTEPIHSLVSVYSSGRSDETKTTKITEFPINEAPFVGYVPESKLNSEMEHMPLDLEKKHIGYYEQLPSTSTKTSEYPKIEEPFVGNIYALQRNEVEFLPIDVDKKHVGFYDILPSTSTIGEPEKKLGALEKLTYLFKGGRDAGEFPVDSDPFTGSITNTNFISEAPNEPILSFVNIYSTGRSDEKTIATTTTEFPKIQSPFIGTFSETNKKSELETFPLEVERRHIGYYKHLPLSTTDTEEEKKQGTIEKLTQIFKESKKTEEFPVGSDPFTGQIASTSAVSEAQNEPIHSLVSIYSSGRSDEIPTTKPALKTTEYPLIEPPFIGNVSESNRQLEIIPIPLDVERSHVGYYDQLPSTIIVKDEEKKPGAIEKLTNLFKRGKTDGAYPTDSEPYIENLATLNIISEAAEEPIHSLVSVYSSGRSDEIPITKMNEYPTNEAPFNGYVTESRIIPELEGIPLEFDKNLTGFPKFEEIYIGHIHELQRGELENLPLEVEKKDIGFYEVLPST